MLNVTQMCNRMFSVEVGRYIENVVSRRYISTSRKRNLRNNIDVIDYFPGANEIYDLTKNAAVKDIDVAYSLGQKYRYPIDIDHGDINPPLVQCDYL